MITLDELTDRLPLLTGAVFAVGFILLILALRMFRHSRGARYWIHRRRAGQRGFRMLIFSMLFLSLSFGLCIATFIFNAIDSDGDAATQVAAVPTAEQVASDTPTATLTPTDAITSTATATETTMATATDNPTSTPTSTEAPTQSVTEAATEVAIEETVIAQAIDTMTATLTATHTASYTPTVRPTTDTVVPSNTPTATITATYTPSPTQSPTATQTASNTPTPTAITPTATPSNTPLPTLPSSAINITPRATPNEDARLTVSAIAEGVDNGDPVNESEMFSSGIRRIYFFMDYEAMSTGVLWRWQLLRDGESITMRALLWGPAGNGESYFFVGQQGGYNIGDYELQVFIGEATEPVTSAAFSVTP